MYKHILVLWVAGLFSCSLAQAAPQEDLKTTVENKAETTLQQTAQAAPVFGSVEAVWQFISNPPHNRGFRPRRMSQTRTHATAVISGNLVFIHATAGFELNSAFTKQPKILELTFTAMDGTKVALEPSYQPLKRHWVVARIKTTAD